VFYIGFKTGPRVDEEGWRHAVGGIELGSDSDRARRKPSEHLVPGEVVTEPDVASHFYAAVGERRMNTGDGEPVSEWTVPFSDVLTFLAGS
jgi:hypothetical protein